MNLVWAFVLSIAIFPVAFAWSGKMAVLTGKSELIRAIAYSPDGTLMVAGGFDKIVALWDIAREEEIRRLGGEHMALSIAFNPNGKIFAIGTTGNTIELWSVTSGKIQKVLRGHTGWVTAVAYSPDGKFLISGSSDKTLRLWDTADYKLITTLRGHDFGLYAVAFSRDGKLLASTSGSEAAGEERVIKIWNMASRKVIATLYGHEKQIWSVAFSKDSKRLVSGSYDGTVRLWDLTTNQELAILSSSGSSWGVAFSPDGRTIAASITMQDKSTVRLWDASSLKVVANLCCHGNQISALAFSPDGKTLASAGGSGRVLGGRVVWDESIILWR